MNNSDILILIGLLFILLTYAGIIWYSHLLPKTKKESKSKKESESKKETNSNKAPNFIGAPVSN